MIDATHQGNYIAGVNRLDEMRHNIKSKMYCFTMLDNPNRQKDIVLKELETQCQYILYYNMDMGAVGVVQLSRAVTKHTLDREYEDFVWRRVKSDEMTSRIGWIHRNKLNVYEAGSFTRRCVVREHKSDFAERMYFYDPDTGRVSKLNDEGVKVPMQSEIDEPK